MSYVEDLFKMYPFIYRIRGEYYALGNGMCTKCNGKSVPLDGRYRAFEQIVDKDIPDKEAWECYHKVMFEAKHASYENAAHNYTEKDLLQFGFSQDELSELEAQVKRNRDFFKSHKFVEWIKTEKKGLSH